MMEKFKEVTDAPEQIRGDKCFLNNLYQVNVRFDTEGNEWKGLVWLSIKRKDKEVIHDWRELQQIKNLLCGEEREAVEIYPAESRLVDSSNQFHLWVFPEGERVPFGYENRLVVEGHSDKSKQRPFKDKEQPKDCKTLEEVKEMVKKNE